jgi:2-deoxy-D-gluconate 3-dehydrogenase
MDLPGASALVTGAGRGIGRAIATALARAGAVVTAVSRTRSELDSLVREIEAAGGRAVAHVADLCDAEAPARVVAAAAKQGRLRILVNNAAVGGFTPVIETSDEEWDRTLGTNLTAVFRLTRAAGLAAYGASKAALDYFSHCLMMEVRQQGVNVITIAPGSVATSFAGREDRGDAGWMLAPEDVAQAVLDLLHARDGALLSRVDMRPLRPGKR